MRQARQTAVALGLGAALAGPAWADWTLQNVGPNRPPVAASKPIGIVQNLSIGCDGPNPALAVGFKGQMPPRIKLMLEIGAMRVAFDVVQPNPGMQLWFARLNKTMVSLISNNKKAVVYINEQRQGELSLNNAGPAIGSALKTCAPAA